MAFVAKEFQAGYDDKRLDRGWNEPEGTYNDDGEFVPGNQVAYEYGRQFYAYFGDKYELRDQVSMKYNKIDVLTAFANEIAIKRPRTPLDF